MFLQLAFGFLKFDDIDFGLKKMQVIISPPAAILLTIMALDSYISTSRLTIWITHAPPRIPRVFMAIFFVFLFQTAGILAHPMSTSVATGAVRHHSISTSAAGSSLTTSADQSDTVELQKKSYYLTLTGTVFTALSLCLSFITTLVALVEFRLRRNRNEARGLGAIGDTRSPINDEASRQARDALAQQIQTDDSNAISGMDMAVLSAVTSVDGCTPPAPMPAERPSRSHRPSQLRPAGLEVETPKP
ncbi:hypothetical protein F5Y13DRAFT_149985 [Hypoxylon sp. FL1857]|nr:hypothetical protein F5Y13DRAFT_149985 [Hypoxylon sp. FL1857]